jgi:two-component system sensor histidine kinase KdpD
MESERLRNSLLAALSHDLRTPLTSLVGLSEALAGRSRRWPRAAGQRARAARRGAAHEHLVANLLDMARSRAAKSAQPRMAAAGRSGGQRLRASAAQLQAHRGSTPAARPAAGALRCGADRARAGQPAGERRQVHAGRRAASPSAALHGAWLQVTVADDGPGLPPGRADILFEKFTRGERESAKPGVGLGLAICRAIVEAHGGIDTAASGAGPLQRWAAPPLPSRCRWAHHRPCRTRNHHD